MEEDQSSFILEFSRHYCVLCLSSIWERALLFSLSLSLPRWSNPGARAQRTTTPGVPQGRDGPWAGPSATTAGGRYRVESARPSSRMWSRWGGGVGGRWTRWRRGPPRRCPPRADGRPGAGPRSCSAAGARGAAWRSRRIWQR